ncbi:MAG: c-type cytochrome [Cytophagaceae bacterium]|nr:c-type cytochrome [Cytophagaceae bacterium]
MNFNALSSRQAKLGLTVALGGALLALSAYQNTGFHQKVAAYLDSTLTENQKRLPENALKGLTIAPGLEVRTVATEPMLTNPTNIDVDERGRIWVCEAYNYRPAINGNPANPKGDRIVILEDTNGDGKADGSKVFYQGPELNAPLGIWVMGNRVIVAQSPYVWLFTDENGDDKADKKEVIFEGVDGEQHDHGMHTFVFGPDGKYYFNFGNAGVQLKDRDGKFVKDQDGRDINKTNYKQGMVFRCDPDFRNVEVLGQNFRNNYEVAVDSYGTMWQSDNDDDGNKGVRINYVMDYGNYGYTDELTGAGWQANRTNLEAEIPLRHWHLNDPGVVPNLLQTGAGSPTGILVYEGNLLPPVFQNQVIHCDAGPNVVRAYPVQKDGAGYKAEVVNVIKGDKDQWFRPADVCVAPDGSLIVADWYDPGVGGHQAGDQQRGRVYRVAPANTPYTMPKFDYSTPAGAVAALQNSNLSVRHLAWNALSKMGNSAVPELENVWKTAQNPRMRARAFWVLAKMEGRGKTYVDQAIKDPNADLRMAGLRAARQLKLNVADYVRQLANDPDIQVRRECALALRHNPSPEAADLWATLATQHDGRDRWYLEALGIGADGQWDRFFAAYQKKNTNLIQNPGSRDIVWRARTDEAVPMLARLAVEPGVDLKDRLRYFRAFDFNPGPAKSRELLKIMEGQAADQTEINRLALRHLDPKAFNDSPTAKKALNELLGKSYGTPEYIELVTRYEVKSENPRLLQMALDKSQDRIGRDASDLLLKQGGSAAAWAVINGKDAKKASDMVGSLRWVGSKDALDILEKVALGANYSTILRRQAAEMIGQSSSGEDLVLNLLRDKKVPPDLIASTVAGVSRAWRKAVRKEAASYLPGANASAGKKMPPMGELLAMNGKPENGMVVFKQNCAICHQVNGEGMDFGPKLSEIGSKLAKEGQYLAILHPSAGISFGYEGWEIKMKDGSTLTGIISSKTETDIDLKYPGGTSQRIKTSAVKSMKQLTDSMMPAGLQENMGTQEFVDLVEYLASLKRK